MAPKRKNRESTASVDPNGMFSGMVVFLIETSVQSCRLQIWKQKLTQMGATISENLSKGVTHIFALNSETLLGQLSKQQLARFKGTILPYQWLEDSLRSGEKVPENIYDLRKDLKKEEKNMLEKSDGQLSSDDETLLPKTSGCFSRDSTYHKYFQRGSNLGDSDDSGLSVSPVDNPRTTNSSEKDHSSSVYKPPDLNKNITEIFGKLINIYRALGEDRRSFSYYKAIPVIEKVPFKIESADQVKNLPSVGKSLQDHIQEIVTTGKLSKLEHFETDEKVRTISLFGEVWGIGPATALKLYEKGYRSLEDLKNEESLTHSQKLGLQYFDDIRQRILRNEFQLYPLHQVEVMEKLLQKAGEDILPGVLIVCGGSYRRGKVSCGDMDIVITHPDGNSQRGFLKKFVKHLKDTGFLREDLVFSTHSEEGTDYGVDTYFGLCTYPGRELRHRIDLKVYPRDIYAFGLIAWTGNDVLNRRLRILAESKGFRLDDTGLFPATRGSDGKKGSKGITSLKLSTEKEVFDFLGFPWLEPHERNL